MSMLTLNSSCSSINFTYMITGKYPQVQKDISKLPVLALADHPLQLMPYHLLGADERLHAIRAI